MGSLTLQAYISQLKKTGGKIVIGEDGTFWIRYEVGAMVRMPTFSVELPSQKELREMFWNKGVACVSYILEADERHPQNAWLYVSTDRLYNLSKLGKGTKWSIKQGLKSLRIEPIKGDELLKHGFEAFSDTRKRVGLSDGTPEEFRRRFTKQTRVSGHTFFGAWHVDQLVAFLSIIDVEDWVEIEGSFSMTAFLKHYPNDTLLFSILTYYLLERRKRLVSYGLSSLQATANKAGLHAFKTKIGFEAKPVHRVFVLHPILRPFVNQLTFLGLNAALRLRPRNRVLKKIRGVLALILGKQ